MAVQLPPSLTAVAILLSCAIAGCGGVDSATACAFDPACSGAGTDATTSDTSTGGDTTTSGDGSGDGSGCKPGETKPAGDGCNTCTCNAKGTFDCTKKICPDSGPPPSDCPKTPPVKGSACVGKTHCIYTDPCPFGCDCVDGKWACVDVVCPCPPEKPTPGTVCPSKGMACTYEVSVCKCEDSLKWSCSG